MKYSYSGDGKRRRRNKYSDIYVFLFCVSFIHKKTSLLLLLNYIARERRTLRSQWRWLFLNIQRGLVALPNNSQLPWNGWRGWSNYNLIFNFAPDLNLDVVDMQVTILFLFGAQKSCKFVKSLLTKCLDVTHDEACLAQIFTYHLIPSCSNVV